MNWLAMAITWLTFGAAIIVLLYRVKNLNARLVGQNKWIVMLGQQIHELRNEVRYRK
jgi:hypothetical protein